LACSFHTRPSRAAWFTFTFAAAPPPHPGKIALTARVLAGTFALVGALLTWWLPELKHGGLPD
jgi:hypothetical protein